MSAHKTAARRRCNTCSIPLPTRSYDPMSKGKACQRYLEVETIPLFAFRQQPKVRQVAQPKLRPGGRVDDEELHRPGPGVERRMKPAFGHEHRAARSDL